jgi:hypothetical protein
MFMKNFPCPPFSNCCSVVSIFRYFLASTFYGIPKAGVHGVHTLEVKQTKSVWSISVELGQNWENSAARRHLYTPSSIVTRRPRCLICVSGVEKEEEEKEENQEIAARSVETNCTTLSLSS